MFDLENTTYPTLSQQQFAPKDSERKRIRRLAHRLKRTVVRPSDCDAPLPLTFTPEEWSKLIEELHSTTDREWKDRTVAAWAIGNAAVPFTLHAKVVTGLRHLLRSPQDFKTFRASKHIAAAIVRTLVFVFPFALMLSFGFSGIDFGVALWACIIGTVLALPFTFSPSTQYTEINNNQAREAAAQALLRLNAVEAIGEVLEGATDKSGLVRRQCRIALYHLLPQITEETRNFMPLNSSELIARLLEDIYRSIHQEGALGEVILDYLEKFGQGRNVTIVQMYVNRIAGLFALGEDDPVVIKGRRVVAILLARRGQADAQQELLRHSTAPIAGQDQLLRPAAASMETPAEQLLRASNSE